MSAESERESEKTSAAPPPQDVGGGGAGILALNRVPGLQLKLDTPKGRGVFTTQRIPSGTVIDICPVLVLSQTDNDEHVSRTSLYHYSYNWPVPQPTGRTRQHQAIVFGLGSMFNHSSQAQNVVWRRDLHHQVVIYTATRDIAEGEELCISYGGNLWFKDADAEEESETARQEEGDEDVLLKGIQLDVDEETEREGSRENK